MALLASVILCSHNPRPDYLSNVLEGLQAQSLSKEDWELLVVDNASDEPLASRLDLGWHPSGHQLREEELGLVSARLSGIHSAAAPILIFVDDDVVLDPDYLKVALDIARSWPILGAWGSGWAQGRFEIEPPAWARAYLYRLPVFQLEREVWSNSVSGSLPVPPGAGLCVRAEVARDYHRRVLADPRRRRLGRVGNALSSCEDTDLAFTACDRGLGTGLFPSLRFTHLIPAERLTLAYFERLLEGGAYSDVILRSFRGEAPPAPRSPGLTRRLLHWYRARRLSPEERRLQAAARRGALRAAGDLLQGR